MMALGTLTGLDFTGLMKLNVGDHLNFTMLAPISKQLSGPFVCQIQKIRDDMRPTVVVFILDQVDADGKQTEVFHLRRAVVDLMLDSGGTITIPTPLEIEEANRRREANLIAALEARMAADRVACATAHERLRLMHPETTT